jgi:hypothetical protein
MTGCDHPRVGEARLHRRPVLAIDDLNLMAVPGKKIGGGRADDTCSEHKRFHGASMAYVVSV